MQPILILLALCSVDGDLRHQVYLCGGGAGGKVCIVRDKRRPVSVHYSSCWDSKTLLRNNIVYCC